MMGCVFCSFFFLLLGACCVRADDEWLTNIICPLQPRRHWALREGPLPRAVRRTNSPARELLEEGVFGVGNVVVLLRADSPTVLSVHGLASLGWMGRTLTEARSTFWETDGERESACCERAKQESHRE